MNAVRVKRVRQIVLVLSTNPENQRLIQNFLAPFYLVLNRDSFNFSDGVFDLCILDLPSYKKYKTWISEIVRDSGSTFLPILGLIRANEEVRAANEDFDELIRTPVYKLTLLKRISRLMKGRAISVKNKKLRQTLLRQVKDLEQSKKKTEEQFDYFHLLSNRVPQIVWMALPHGRIIYANDRWYSYTNQDRTGNEGIHFVDQLHPKDRASFRKMFAQCLASETQLEIELRIRSGGLTYLWFLVRAQPSFSSAGQVKSWFGTCTEIEEQKKLQMALKRATDRAHASNVIKSNFLANMSHEIRTPLGAILGFVNLLKDTPLNSEQSEFVEIIHRNGGALSDLINDILDLSKVEAGEFKTDKIAFSFPKLIGEVLELFSEQAARKKVVMQVSSDNKLPKHIISDPLRVRQILINILGNALKFTDSGTITISAKWRKKSRENECHTGVVTFLVTDTGIGMSQEQAKKLFKPFTQATSSHGTTQKYGGTGLGLALSRHFARLLGGDITIPHCAPEKGSTFKITFEAGLGQPLRRENLTRLTKMTTVCSSRVLVIDDTEDNRKLVSYYLTKKGFFVATAQNGSEGLAMALEGNFDIILLDIQMPTLDGFETMAELRRNNFNNPIVALTANAMSEDYEKTKTAGFSAHLVKPLEWDKLYETLIELTKQ